MRATQRTAAAIGLTAVLCAAAWAVEPVRLVNGTPVEGEVADLKPEGLEAKTPKGPVTYPWPALSTATRYRFQPGYRESFADALEGKAVPAGVEPDARIKSLIPSLAQAAPKKEPAAGPATPAPKPPAAGPKAPADRRLLGSQKDDVNTWGFKGADIPGLPLDNAEHAEVVGLKFGPEKEHVVYLAFEPSLVVKTEKGSYGKMEKAYAYAPSDPRFGKATLLKATSEGARLSGDKPVEFVAKSGQSEYRLKLGWAFGSGGQSSLTMTGEVSAVVSGKKAVYLARTGVNPTRGLQAPTYIRPIYGEPAIVARITDGGRKFKGRVMIGEMPILPLQAADTKMKIDIVDDAGRSVANYTVRSADADFTKEDGWSCDFKKLAEDKEYTARCTMDLGPLGVAKLDSKFRAFDLGL